MPRVCRRRRRQARCAAGTRARAARSRRALSRGVRPEVATAFAGGTSVPTLSCRFAAIGPKSVGTEVPPTVAARRTRPHHRT
ncbi:DUF6053 domain-containing protein [Lysobacter yananisis]|uniref:DUF6053 domain-containing protein n=1 Tax=Lysobacter yananisis TaxID=1003114 RepID=UPI003CE5B91C